MNRLTRLVRSTHCRNRAKIWTAKQAMQLLPKENWNARVSDHPIRLNAKKERRRVRANGGKYLLTNNKSLSSGKYLLTNNKPVQLICEMVKIEYSPNSASTCQSCHHKILYGQIRVCVKAASEFDGRYGRYGGGGIAFINKYHHANCYSNRRDFTKFYGFYKLIEEDQKRFMSASQIRERFGPQDDGKEEEEDKVEVDAVAYTPTAATLASDAIKCPTASLNDENKAKDDVGHERILTVTGLKYAAIAAVIGQKVVVVREPENKYDANAVKVTNVAGQTIGHVKKEEAARLSPFLALVEGKYSTEGTILTCGDGYTQMMRLVMVPKERYGEGEKVPASLTVPVSPLARARSQTAAATRTDFYDDTDADFDAAIIAATEAAEAKLMEVSKARTSDDTPVPPSKWLKTNPGDKKRASNTSTCADIEATPRKKIMNPYTDTNKKTKKVTP